VLKETIEGSRQRSLDDSISQRLAAAQNAEILVQEADARVAELEVALAAMEVRVESLEKELELVLIREVRATVASWHQLVANAAPNFVWPLKHDGMRLARNPSRINVAHWRNLVVHWCNIVPVRATTPHAVCFIVTRTSMRD
jgi:hypothetical protein